MRLLSLTLVGLLLVPAAWAQDVLIKNATVHTMTSAGVLTGTDILMANGEITRIGENLAGNDQTVVIDAQGRPVTPGLFAGITVTGLAEVSAVSEAVDSHIKGLFTELMHPEFDVRDAYNPHSSVIPVTRTEGLTYALLAATEGDRSIAGLGSLVRFDGGYDSFDGRPVLFVDIDGHSADSVGGSRAAHWMLLNQAFAERNAKDGDLSLLTPIGKRTLVEVSKRGLFVFNAHRASDIHRALQFAAAHNIQIVIHGGREAWLVADELASANVPVVLNALENLPANFDSLGARLDNAALLHEAGVSVIFTSGETHNARKVRQVAGSAVANGMPYEAALRAMSSEPSRVFGGQARVIQEGALADLVLWSGDPLELTEGADAVIIAGEVTSMETRQTRLRDRYFAPKHPLGPAYNALP
jgi:hypothetical protein